jgi:hypothetical protein
MPSRSSLCGTLALGVLACCAVGCAASGKIDDGDNPMLGTGGQSAGGQGQAAGQGANASGSSSVAMGIDLLGSPQYYRFVRLTNAQWAQSVQDTLELPAASGLESSFENPVAGTTDFTNNELLLDVNQRSWGDFQAAAETLAEQVTSSASQLASIYSGTDAAGFIKAFGRRAYRRPLTATEVRYQERVRQGRGVGHPRDAAVALLLVSQ